MYFPRLASRVKYLKEDEEGVVIVSNYFKELEAKAVQKAQKRERETIVSKMLDIGKLTL